MKNNPVPTLLLTTFCKRKHISTWYWSHCEQCTIVILLNGNLAIWEPESKHFSNNKTLKLYSLNDDWDNLNKENERIYFEQGQIRNFYSYDSKVDSVYVVISYLIAFSFTVYKQT